MDFLCFNLYCFHLDGVGEGYLLFAPTGVPLFKINSVGTSDKRRMGRIGRMFQCAAPVLNTDAVVEIDAVALKVGGGVVSRGGTRNLLAAATAKQNNARYQ